MNADYQEALFEAWPEIFRKRDLDPSRTAMCSGIQCDDGWVGLIDALCEVTNAHALTGAHPVLAATGVKQKFGSLRVRFADQCPYCDGARTLVEEFSTYVCEVSGRRGSLVRVHSGGVMTLAPAIADQLGSEVVGIGRLHSQAPIEAQNGWQEIVELLLEIKRSSGREFDFATAADRSNVSINFYREQAPVCTQSLDGRTPRQVT